MSPDNLKAWRKTLGLTQEEAAEKFGVSRATVIAWESGAREIPTMIDLVCSAAGRAWKQRPGHGPVTLVYADAPMWLNPYGPRRMPMLQMELYPNNAAALERCCELVEGDVFFNPFIMVEGGDTIWSATELFAECRRRASVEAEEAPVDAA